MRKGKLKVKSINDFTSEDVGDRGQVPCRGERRATGGRALRLHQLRGVHQQPPRGDPRQPPRGADREPRCCARTPTSWWPSSSANWNCGSSSCRTNSISARWNASSSRSASTRRSRSAAPTRRCSPRCTTGSSRFRKQLLRELSDADVERLLQVRIRRISLFDIHKHREETEKIKAELAETRKTPQAARSSMSSVICRRCSTNTGRSIRASPGAAATTRWTSKEVAFKAFKVAYDRESGYVGHKVNGDEFKTECTKFDKMLLVFKDGSYKVAELPEKLFVGPAALLLRTAGARARVHPGLHQPPGELSQTLHLRRLHSQQALQSARRRNRRSCSSRRIRRRRSTSATSRRLIRRSISRRASRRRSRSREPAHAAARSR